MSAPCPGLDELRALLDGALPADAAEVLQTHVSGCEQCQRSLEGLTAGGESWVPVVAGLKQADEQREERLRMTIDRIKTDAPDGFRASDLERLTQSTLDVALQLEQQGHLPGAVLVRVMEECLRKLDAGEAVDREALVAAHPELADQLEACLASLEFIHRVAHPSEGAPARLGDFRIVREIGRGGMGVVYEAEQLSLKRQVALKVLRFGAAPDPEAMQRFQREAETVAALHHTNIVPVFAIGSEQGVHYYAMQLIEGRSLKELCQQEDAVDGSDGNGTTETNGTKGNGSNETDENAAVASVPVPIRLIRPSGPIDPSTIAHWGLQAAEALAHAHQRGVVHRDIKPSNLILGSDGRIWLTDFGLAKRLDDVTLSLSGALLGTPRYMSPEQASALHKPVDHRTDIYSLGATLYELVTRKPLFESQSPHVVIAQILSVEPPPPRKLVPDLPRDLETIILKCLSKEAGLRYQSAQELADDLRAFIEGRAIRARRVSVVEHAARWIKQNNKQLVTTVAAVAVTIVALTGGTLFWKQYDELQNGSLVLKTKSGPLTAEVIDERGELVVPTFTVPNEQPVTVPAGDYLLRVSGRGALSRSARFGLHKSQKLELDVDLDREQIRKPIPVHGASSYEFVDFGDGPELIVLPKSPNDSQGEFREGSNKKPLAEVTKLKRISLRTGQEVWSINVQKQSEDLKHLLPDDKAQIDWWQATVFGWQLNSQKAPKVLRPLPDLDADGTPDLIWLLNQGKCVFAVSGKTGKPLWWHRPEGRSEQKEPQVVHTAAFQEARVVPIKRGDADESLLMLVEQLFDPPTQRQLVTLRAVRLSDRETVWRMPLGARQNDGSNDPSVRLAAVDPTAGTQFVAMIDGKLQAFDASNGQLVGSAVVFKPTEKSSSVRCGDLRVLDVDGDQLPEVVLLMHPHEQAATGSLNVLSLSATDGVLSSTHKGRSHWSVTTGREQYFIEHEMNAEHDLNGDGVREIVLIDPRTELDCRVFDSRSGKELWRRRIPGHYSESRNSAPVIGADIDGDGWRDVFVMSIRPDGDFTSHNDRRWLYADCFSGKDGRSLWWSRQPVEGRASPFLSAFEFKPQFLEHGPNGRSALLVPMFVEVDHRTEGRLWTIDAHRGQFLETGMGISRADLIDWNDDGYPELSVFVTNEDHNNHHEAFTTPGELTAFRGTSPLGWRRSGSWTPLGDLDGDGLTELWNPHMRWHESNPIVSGKSGEQVADWSLPHEIHVVDELLVPTSRERDRKHDASMAESSMRVLQPFDLNGDGQPDLLGYGSKTESYSDRVLPEEIPLGVRALSGRNGSGLWPMPLVKAPQWGRRTFLRQDAFVARCVDLDGDGNWELAVPYLFESQNNHQPKAPAKCSYDLALLDLRTGRVQWQSTLLEETGGEGVHNFWSSGDSPIRILDVADLDGDHVQDFVIKIESSSWFSHVDRPLVVQARSGRDGHLLWPEVRGKFQRVKWEWRNFLQVGVTNLDGKGPPEVVLLDFHSDDEKGEQAWRGEFELRALDGGTGRERFVKRWSGELTKHGHSESHDAPRLLTLRAQAGERGAIVVTRSEFLPSKPSNPGEDWLLRVPEMAADSEREAAQTPVELQIVERLPRVSDDQVVVVDLQGDGVDELLSLRRKPNRNWDEATLMASRGLKETLWSLPKQVGHGMQAKVLDEGRLLLVIQHQRLQFVSAEGQLLVTEVTSENRRPRLAMTSQALHQAVDAALGVGDAKGSNAVQVLIDRDGTTESKHVALRRVNAEGSGHVGNVPHKLPRLGRDSRLVRPLPWVERDMGKNGLLIISIEGVICFVLVVLPLLVLRLGWRERRAVWPFVWTVLGVLVWCGGSWQIIRVVCATVMGEWFDLIPSMQFLLLLAAGLPVAWLPILMVRWWSDRRVRPVIVLGVLMVVSTLGLMTLLVVRNRPHLHISQSYDWSGWYLILPMGCYGGLWLWLIGDGLRGIGGWMKRRVSKSGVRHSR